MPVRNPSGDRDVPRDAAGGTLPFGPRHGRAGQLGAGWTVLAVVIGIMAALIALGGMILSFRAVSAEMVPAFGARWAWLVPIVIDLTVFVFSGVDLVLARLDMSHPLARWTVYGATGGTVWLNYSAGGSAAGRVAHVLMPAIWVVFIELMRHVVRRQVNLATASHREPVPAARWVLAPFSTLKLWRRMILWRVNSYPAALGQERVRLARIAAVRQQHGWTWRWRVPALDRLSISLGEASTPPVPTSAAAEQSDNAPSWTERETSSPGAAEHSSAERIAQSNPGALPAWLAPRVQSEAERPMLQSDAPARRQSAERRVQRTQSKQSGISAGQSAEQSSRAPFQSTGGSSGSGHSDDALEYLTAEETAALSQLTAACAPNIPSQGAIRSALPPGPDGRRCGATRAIRIQRALRARAEHPDAPDPLSDALDSEFAATTS